MATLYAKNVMELIEHHCKTKCGYATVGIEKVKDKEIKKLLDNMESYFFAEVKKKNPYR
jgi:hypothetical protein